MNGPLIIQASVLHDFYVQVFLRTGVPEADAHMAAAVRLESALRLPAGLDAFAVIRLQNTVRRLQAGGINPTPRLKIVQEGAPFALLDGDNGLGAVVGTRAMDYCLTKAHQQGLALVGVRIRHAGDDGVLRDACSGAPDDRLCGHEHRAENWLATLGWCDPSAGQ